MILLPATLASPQGLPIGANAGRQAVDVDTSQQERAAGADQQEITVGAGVQDELSADNNQYRPDAADYPEEIPLLDVNGIGEMTVTVRQRAPAPVLPSSRTIKAAEFKGKFPDLPSVLETVSGVDIRTTGGYGQYAESAIRSSSAKGVRVYLDGVLLNSAAGGAVDLSKIPLDRITEIRVTKGASGGLRQMGEGMGGMVELFTADSAQRVGSDGGVGVNKRIVGVDASAGSFGLIKGGMIVRSGASRVRHQVGVDIAKSDNNYPFMHDNGTVIPTLRDPDPTWDDTLLYKRNNYYRSVDAAYSVSVDIDENRKLSQQLSAGGFDQGLFAYHYKDNQSGSTGGRTVVYGVDYSGVMSDNLTVGGEASGIYRHNTLSDPDGHFSLGGAGRGLESDGYTAAALVDARYSLTDRFYLSALSGARVERHVQRNLALSGRPYMNRYECRAGTELGVTSNGYGWELRAAEAALRVAYHFEADTSSVGLGYFAEEGRGRTLSYPLAEAAVRLKLTPAAVIQLTAATSKRAPTFYELFGWGSGFLSNPNLTEETRTEVDLGASIDKGECRASASIFGGSLNDKIKSIPRAGGFVKVMNFADTKFWGAEAEASAKLFKVLAIELSASYIESIISNAVDRAWVGKVEPFVPTLSGYLKTEIDVKRINVGHGVKYESMCYLGIANRETRPMQYELSAWAAVKATEFLTLRYRVTNYLNTASFDFLDNPKPRRMHMFSVSLK
ncbi:MAG: TonB-dependent receptor plug domain-containing protein [Chitinispirillales bacterium]|nr:TonB-dependent receptor plug domain-containing protein [Chitinispirillales bacterium]